MSEKEKVKSEIQILRDAFEGMKDRQPKSDEELKGWLATDEGKKATMFESTTFSRFGETGHAYRPPFADRKFNYRCLRVFTLGQKRTCAAHKPMSAKCQKRQDYF